MNCGCMTRHVSKVDELLRTAIEQKRLIRVLYRDKVRIVEPHDYGVHKGCVKLLTYQIGGSSSQKLPSWRWMDIDSMSDIHLLDETFAGGRPAQVGKHHKWDNLFVRVKPAGED
jgi:hypothetical protein